MEIDLLKRSSWILLCFALLLPAVLAGCAGCLGGSQNDSGDAGGISAGMLADSEKSTLLAIYMVGSDLESESGAGTTDLLDLVSGFSAQPEDCLVVVGYGGANTDGWRGMRIASIAELEQDAADGVIGNDGCFIEEDPEANMGDPATLAGFLAYVNGIEGYDQRYLILWDHGSGYEGFGCDEVHDDMLTLAEMKSAFSQSKKRYDLIGFDACLMSMTEVAVVLEPYAGLLVASEETEPGSGWEYAALARELSERPGVSPAAFGKAVVDSYMVDPDGEKTLALLDLEKTGELLAARDGFGVVLEKEGAGGNFEPAGQSFWYSQAFDSNPAEDYQTSIDLADLALSLRENIPACTREADRLIEALDAFVLYARHDEHFSKADGVAIASPRFITSDTLEHYRNAATVSPGWDAFFDSYVETKSGDHEDPVLTENEDDWTFSVSDNLGVAEVMLVYCIEAGEETLAIGEVPVLPDSRGNFVMDSWNGEWYCLDTGDGPRLPLYLSYEGTCGGSRQVYYSPVEITRNGKTTEAALHVYIDPVGHTDEIIVEPFETDETGEVETGTGGWTDETLLPGDVLTAYAAGYDEPSGEDILVETGTITVTSGTRLSYGMMPAGVYSYGLRAEDFNGNIVISPAVIIEVE